MGNILNHNRTLIDFMLTNEDYWDFHLSTEMGYGSSSEGLSTECLSAFIDFNDPNCISWDDAVSKEEYKWEYSINEGVDLNYIGVTGVDNGFIKYQKDRISNKDFLNIFLNSTYNTEKDDLRLRLRKVDGNNQIYDYYNEIVKIDDIEAAEVKGGFYQGFFKLYDKKYQVLPYVLENGWNMEVKLKKSDLLNEKHTINDEHPNNKGMFLYIGTRAENKWWEKYLVETTFENSNFSYNNDNYFEDGYLTDSGDVNASYFGYELNDDYLEIVYGNDGKHCKEVKCRYFEDDYIEKGYYDLDSSKDNRYAMSEYYEEEEEITGNEELVTEDGIEFSQPNMIKYETDNKFLLFNRSYDGFTVKTWEEGTKVTMYDVKKPDIGNYHLLFNRTPEGYTIENIGEVIEKENKKYNVLKDLYRNALGFQIKDDGSIGFKYLVKDCESDEESYKIEEMFSNENVITDDKWYTINIKIMPLRPRNLNNPTCDDITTSSSDGMQIYIYVDGKLKLKSNPLPILNLRALDDLSDKQQGVPFSISLGGGTQGLCDVVNLNFMELPKYLLPLEKEFCGSFVGYIHFFRFYSCPLNFTEIQENYRFGFNI